MLAKAEAEWAREWVTVPSWVTMPASRRPGRASPSSPPGTPSEHPHSDTCSRLVLLPMIVFSSTGSTSLGGPLALV